MCLSCFFFTLFLAFLFCLFLRSRALVDSIQVYLSQDIYLWLIEDFSLIFGLKWRLILLFYFLLSRFYLLGSRNYLLRSNLRFCSRRFYLLLFCLWLRLRNWFYRFLFHLYFLLNGLFWSFILRLWSYNWRFLYYRFGLSFLHFVNRAYGNSLWFSYRSLCLSNRRFVYNFVVSAIQVYLSQRFILLAQTANCIGSFLFAGSLGLCSFLLLGFFQEKFACIRFHFLVLLESFFQCCILAITEFEVRVVLYFTQILPFFQELHCRLEPDVQFTNCFVQSDAHVYPLS